jgi:rubrerythrin
MKKETELGMNRTGMALAPKEGKRQKENVWTPVPGPIGDTSEIGRVRAEYYAESGPVGTVSPPATLKGAAKAAMKSMQGKSAAAFIDKLGERLAFERTGTRLYDLLLGKFRSGESETGDADLASLTRFRDEEGDHFLLLWRCLEKLGADPTVQTPSADHTGVKAMGLLQTIADPRTTFSQALDAILIAEAADNEGWKLLTDLAESLGEKEMAKMFRHALAEEEVHLEQVRQWMTGLVRDEAGVEASTGA